VIVVESAGAALVRVGEALVAGRRLAGRLLPYGPEGERLRFDPVERRFVVPRPEPVLAAGPWDPGPWEEALGRLPAGPVLVGPSSSAEAVRGAYRAASEAALRAGRPVYLLDPEEDGIPANAGAAAVVLATWRAGRAAAAFPALGAARAAGLRSAAVFPLIPGWTGEPEALEALAHAARGGGANALSSVLPALDGEARRDIVQARAAAEPDATERFFDLVHHGALEGRLAAAAAAAREAAARHGLAPLPARPVGRGERPGNAAASARLEDRAERPGVPEHRVAQFLAAVRWIDDSPRDLAAIAREGNFRKVFPFGDEAAEAAEAAFREGA
jgi:hypothetical protein